MFRGGSEEGTWEQEWEQVFHCISFCVLCLPTLSVPGEQEPTNGTTEPLLDHPHSPAWSWPGDGWI